ncbi:glutaredoxin family protein [Neobacillus ginsengisoli]
MAQNKRIIIWSKKACPNCEEVKNYLSEAGYKYTSIDVENKDYLRDVLETKYGIRHVPVIEVGSEQVYEAIWEKDFEKLKILINK